MSDQIGAFLLQTLALGITCALIPGLRITSIFGPFLMVIALSLFNSLYWDEKLFFTLPNDLSLQALYLLLSNAFIFWILVKLLPGIEISGILQALLSPIVFTLVSTAVSHVAPFIDWQGLANSLLELISSVKRYLLDYVS